MPATHLYFVDGVRVPSVTQIISRALALQHSRYSPSASARGTEVHEAIRCIESNDRAATRMINTTSVGFVAAWMRFRQEQRWQTLGCEEVVYHPRYAGRLDLRGLLDGVEAIADLKTGHPAEWHGLQLAGYANAFWRQTVDGRCVSYHGKTFKRINLYLHCNGSYRVVREWRGLSYDDRVWDERWERILNRQHASSRSVES